VGLASALFCQRLVNVCRFPMRRTDFLFPGRATPPQDMRSRGRPLTALFRHAHESPSGFPRGGYRGRSSHPHCPYMKYQEAQAGAGRRANFFVTSMTSDATPHPTMEKMPMPPMTWPRMCLHCAWTGGPPYSGAAKMFGKPAIDSTIPRITMEFPSTFWMN